MNTYEFLRIPAQIVPQREALVCEGRRYSFEELDGRVGQLAAGFRQLGVGRGHVVAAVDTNSDHYIMAFYATALLGATFVPLNCRVRRQELTDLLTTSHTATILAGGAYTELVEEAAANIPAITNLVSFDASRSNWIALGSLFLPAAQLEPVEIGQDDVNLVIFTSGTTRKAKGVQLRYTDLANFVLSTALPPTDDTHFAQLLVAPFYHVAGLTAMLRAPYSGRRMVVHRHFDARLWLQTIEAERVTHAFVVPTMLKRLVDEPSFKEHDLSRLEILSYGAAPMPLHVLLRALEMFPKSVGFVNAYGQTESTSTVAMLWPEDHRLTGTPEEIERKKRRLRSIGRPVPGVDVRIVDDERHALGMGQVGEIALRSSRTMKGYLKEEGDEIFPPACDAEGWLYTSDLGWLDEDGYIYLAGRKADRIIRGGENIAPAEVEAVLLQHPAVEEVAVIGIPDEEWGERVLAVVILHPETRGASEETLAKEMIELCRDRLASFKKPEKIVFVDEFPRTPLGKVLKPVLRKRLGASFPIPSNR